MEQIGRLSKLKNAPSYDWNHSIVHDVSRTFSITINLLDDPMKTNICVGYLLCRIPDTIEDSKHIPPIAKVNLLSTYAKSLVPHHDTSIDQFVKGVEKWIPKNKTADWELVQNAGKTIALFESLTEYDKKIIRSQVIEMVDGMTTFIERYDDVGGLRIKTAQELGMYCYYVAGTVGHMITDMVCSDRSIKHTKSILHQNATSFGKRLQLTNIAKDVYDDYTEENNIYLPENRFTERNINHENVIDEHYYNDVEEIVLQTTKWAKKQSYDVNQYLRKLPNARGNTQEAWLVPNLLSVATIREVEQNPQTPLTETRVAVEREEVANIIEIATTSNQKPAQLAKRVREGEFK